MAENLDSRVLGAISLVDAATGQRIVEHMSVSSGSATLFRNRSSLYVISDAGGLANYVASFDTPSAPPVGSSVISLEVTDPNNKYLSRVASIALPRDAIAANWQNSDSVFQPISLELYRNVQTKTLVNWSLVRVTAEDGSGAPVSGAFVQVLRVSDDELLGRGITDQRGEALVIIPNIPITIFSDSDEDEDEDDEDEPAVLVMDINARVEISVAPATQWPVDPDVLQANHNSQIEDTANTSLRTGRTEVVRFVLS